MIEIERKQFNTIKEELNKSIGETYLTSTSNLGKETLDELHKLFSSKEALETVSKINQSGKSQDLSYEELQEIEFALSTLQDKVSAIKYKEDLDIFFKDGSTIDIEKIKEKFKQKGLYKQYPKFRFDRLKELFEYPPKELKCNYSDDMILIDSFVFRKYLTGIIQMVLDEMDLVVAVTGGEGSGKSTHISQLMYMVWWMIHELKIVEYEFKIDDMFFNSLENLRNKEDDFFDKKFRLMGLDEGNELHRQNWRDEEVQTFFQRLRRERFNQRIKFIGIPVLGELMTQVVLSRVNFIHEMVNTSDVRTASLNKGKVNFYIIPRARTIYSPFHKKELKRGDVKTALFENLKDKNYLKGIDESILSSTYRCNGTWSWKHELYIKKLKDSNKIFRVSKGFKLTDWEAYCFYNSGISLRLLGIKKGDWNYGTLNKMLYKVKKQFEENPTLLKNMQEQKQTKDAKKQALSEI